MGTNYYIDDYATCDNPTHTTRLHIGKASAGWKFQFQAYPDHEPPLVSWSGWRDFIAARVADDTDGAVIWDEYDQWVPFAGLADTIENRSVRGRPWCSVDPTPETIARGFGGRYTPDPERVFHDPDGYDFTAGDWS